MVDSGYIHLIGSDAHNKKKRNFCIKECYDFLLDIKGIEFVNYLKNNVNNIIAGKNIKTIYFDNNKKVNKTYYLIKKIFKLLRYS